ncbi:MAG: UDP-3-O-(3-hydroxymyristoyl)glucosamine N-acyltransferase [Planctomycetota bacterium]
MTPRTLQELAELCRAELRGDGSKLISGAARLDHAAPDQVSFLAQARYREHLVTTRAGGVIVGRDVTTSRADLALLVCDDPELAFDAVALAFAPPVPAPAPGVHATAVVDPSARLGAGVSVGPFCVVGPGAALADGVVLHPRVTIGAGVSLGARSELHPGVVIYAHCVLGEDCVVHAGTVIGSDGFGYRHTPAGWTKTPQVGNVELGDRVEVGANCTLDCGRFGPTRIGAGTKIDNLVHVAHNVEVGEGCLLIAQVGVAGSTRLGRGVIVAGQAGIAGHLEVGAGARIGGGAGVITNVPGGTDWFGYPARPRIQAMRNANELDRLPELRRRVRELERQLGVSGPRESKAGAERGGPSAQGAEVTDSGLNGSDE